MPIKKPTLASFFDISARQEIEAKFKTPSHDKFFIFSGPPFFKNVSSPNVEMCPLLFTQAFVVNEQRGGGGQVGSLGTTKSIKLPSSNSVKNISINGFALITGDPTGADTGNENRYNLLKRLYYSVITYDGGELVKPFLYSSSKNNNGFKAVGYDMNDLFTNIGDSEFYDIPFGLMSVCMTKGNDLVVARYYENCTLAQGSPIASSTVNAPVNLTGSIAMTFSEEIPLDIADVQKTASLGGSVETTSFIDTLMAYIGEG